MLLPEHREAADELLHFMQAKPSGDLLAVKDDLEERAESTVLNTGVSEQARPALGDFAFIRKWVESEAVPTMGLCTHCLGVSGKDIISKVKINYKSKGKDQLYANFPAAATSSTGREAHFVHRGQERWSASTSLPLSNKKAASSWCVSLQQLCFKQRTLFQLCLGHQMLTHYHFIILDFLTGPQVREPLQILHINSLLKMQSLYRLTF